MAWQDSVGASSDGLDLNQLNGVSFVATRSMRNESDRPQSAVRPRQGQAPDRAWAPLLSVKPHQGSKIAARYIGLLAPQPLAGEPAGF
jgi:hypothetical protein